MTDDHDSIIKQAAERQELRNLTGDSQLEITMVVFERIFGTFERRIPTNPATYKEMGKDI